jgi:uncharacterized protein YcbX
MGVGRIATQPEPVASIASIYRYLVKSMAGEAVTEVPLEESGLFRDRLYAFESSGAPAGMLRLAGQERRAMLAYRPALRPDGRVEVRVPSGEAMPVESPALAACLREQSQGKSDFVLTRALTPQTDVRPLSLISLQTVSRLSQQMGQTLDPLRFRANLYLDMPQGPFAEDSLVGRTLRIGATAEIRLRERDPRCRFITYDPQDPLAAPLFSLMKLLDRHHEGKCGVYATVKTPGHIQVGDPVWLADESPVA